MALAALRAYADGFLSSLMGGLLYCLVIARIQPEALDSAWWRVGAMSLIFGGVELWRDSHRRRVRSQASWIPWVIAVSLLALWTAGVLLASPRGRGAQPGWETPCLSGCGADGLRHADTESRGRSVRRHGRLAARYSGAQRPLLSSAPLQTGLPYRC